MTCPFCGHTDWLHRNDYRGYGYEAKRRTCDECACYLTPPQVERLAKIAGPEDEDA